MKNQTLFIRIFFLVLFLCPALLSFEVEAALNEVTLFGPEVFIRDTGSPQTVTRNFSIETPATSYLLKVQNGSLEGDDLVSSAVITLNGTTILKQNDFNQNAYSLEEPVTLQTENILEVKLGSIPSSYITITIVGYYPDQDPDIDDDGDGYTENQGDCDDTDSSIYPGANEICDGVDNNCDGQIDEGVKTTYYQDSDSDGYGVTSNTMDACSLPTGYAAVAGDCDDSNPGINPGVTETCDGVDNNCNAQIDEGFDQDGDGYTSCGGDCDDTNPAINPGASEIECDTIDQDCDGSDLCVPTCTDNDGDGYGNPGDASCPNGSALDCDDTDLFIYPGGEEICDGVDNNCNEQIDEGLLNACGACGPLPEEVCDGIDNNCNEQIDEGCLTDIMVSPAAITLTGAGSTQQLTVTGYYAEGGTIDLTASSTGTTYFSNNPSAATVDTEGLVTVVADGTAIITADNSGFTNTSTVTVSIGVADIIPPQITISSPQHQEESYASTVDVIGTVNEPAQSVIVNGTPATINNLTFTAAGISLDQCENTITVEAQDLAGNSSTKSIIVYNNTFSPEVTSESGYIVGYILEYGTETPIQSARITVEGICGSLLTDVNGRYVFPLQGFGSYSPTRYFNIKAEMPNYTHVNFQTQGMIGKEVPADQIYLTPVDTQVTTITPSLGGAAVNSLGDTEVVYPPGAVSEDIDVTITMYDTEEQLPAPLKGRELYAIGEFAPHGTTFNVPVTVRLPNRYNMPAGTLVPCVDYDPVEKIWNDVGDGIVSSDERFIDLEVQHFSSYGAVWVPEVDDDPPPDPDPTPPEPEDETAGGEGAGGEGEGNEEQDKCNSAVSLKQGRLKLSYSLASYRSLGQERSLDLVYNSSTAYPQAAVSFSTSSTRSPKYTKANIKAFGEMKSLFLNNDDGKFTWMTEAKDAQGQFVKSGVYPYSLLLTNYYDVTRNTQVTPGQWVTSIVEKGWSTSKEGAFVINNKIDSSFGSGWSLASVSRLKRDQGLHFPILEGDGKTHTFEPLEYWIDTVAGGGVGDGGSAATSNLYNPSGMATDSAGNIYIADRLNHRIRKVDTNGIITTVAGNRTQGFSGDEGQASEASLYSPEGVAVDSSGNIYIADTSNYRIRKVDTNGIITTVAGNGVGGYSGDGGLATEASLYVPRDVYVDTSGNIYIIGSWSHRIRKVDINGIITTVAGNGIKGYSGDDGLATEANLNGPYGVTVDSSGNIYIADYYNQRIRKVDTSGIITTVAGNGSYGSAGDGGPAISAMLRSPSGVVLDASGNLYIADSFNNRIRKVDTNGIISTVAGSGAKGYSGDEGPATSASLNLPRDVTVDYAGNIYIADYVNNRIRKVDTSGVINTFAGVGTPLISGDGDLATRAKMNLPYGVDVDSSGNIYIADMANQNIRKVDLSGIINTVAGNGTASFSGDGGQATDASLRYPRDVAVAPTGNIYIADTFNNRIRKVDTNGIISTIAGNGTAGYSGDGGPAINANLYSPSGLATDSAGNIYIADERNHRIRKVDADGIITTVAGNGTSGYSGDEGQASEASLSSPEGVTVDSSGNIYIADMGNNRIRKVDTNGIITTVAGNGLSGYSGDGGLATEGRLNAPYEVAVTSSGEIYIGDLLNRRVRKVDLFGKITTLAGNGLWAYSGDGGEATEASLKYAYGLAVDSVGNIYIADAENGSIRIASPYLALKNSTTGFQTFSKDRESGLNLSLDGTAEWVLKNGTKKTFNANGFQTATIDRNGNTTTYYYDPSDNLISITDPVGQVTSLSYSGDKLGSITTPDGRSTLFTHDADGNLTSITEPDGSTTQYVYDNRHLVTSKIRPSGETTQYNFDANGRIYNVVAPTGENREYTPADATGLINDLAPDVGTKTNPATNIPADPSAKVDGMGYTHTYKTDARGATLEYTDPSGNLTQTERDDQSRPIQIIRADGTETTMTYDPKGNLLTATNVDLGATTEMTYNDNSQVTSITDPLGNVTTMTYDTNGNLEDMTDALGNQTTFTYDTQGIVTSVTDALGNLTTYTYDTNGNLASITDALGNATTYTRNAAGSILTRTDANGNTTAYGYDNMNRVISVTDAEGNTTSYSYAPSCGCESGGGNKISSITDANGNITSYAYNEIGQRISETDPMGRITTYTYDTNRQLATRTDPNGDTITYTYDELNRLIEKQMPGDTANFSYDTVGRLTSAEDTDSSLAFTYDTAGRLTDIVNSLGAVSYTYDLNGNRLTMTDAEGGTTDYIYDALNRLTDMTNPSAETSTFTYDTLSRRVETLLPNGGTSAYTFDAVSRLVDLVNEVNASSVSGFAYTYDNVGNRLTMTDKDGLHNYGYDDIYRLLTATHPQPENPTEAFTYDPVGNRLSDSTYSDQTYNANNQLTSYDGVTYTYDNNGNTISKTDPSGTTYYTYDPENRLTRIDFPDATYAEYKYDPFGRRIEKNVNSSITKYLYNGEDILAEYDATSTRIARYTHGPGIDEPLIMERGGSSYYYNADGLGSITEITDSTGYIVNEYVYNSFGKIVKETENVVNPYTYTARERDKESNLYFYRARYYDPAIGRFISADPIGLAGGINLYSYVLNNPVKYVDPRGRSHLLWEIIVEGFELVFPHDVGEDDEQDWVDAHNESAKKAEETEQILKDMERLTEELEESSEWMDEKHKRWLEEQKELNDPNGEEQTWKKDSCP